MCALCNTQRLFGDGYCNLLLNRLELKSCSCFGCRSNDGSHYKHPAHSAWLPLSIMSRIKHKYLVKFYFVLFFVICYHICLRIPTYMILYYHRCPYTNCLQDIFIQKSLKRITHRHLEKLWSMIYPNSYDYMSSNHILLFPRGDFNIVSDRELNVAWYSIV